MAIRHTLRLPPRSRRWTRAEYDRLITLGLLDEDEPIELLGGEMVVKELQAGPHATAVQWEPVRSSRSRHGWRYARVVHRRPRAAVSPLTAPRARVRVADLLP
jgi:hypothetical protein